MIQLLFNGNIGKDAVVKTIEGGYTVINFSVAHTKRYKSNNGEKRETTTWISCEWWTDKTAIAAYLTKGKKVLVNGEPSADWYNNNQQGITSYLKCRVFSLELIGDSSQGNSQETPQKGKQGAKRDDLPNPDDIKEPVDDLPF